MAVRICGEESEGVARVLKGIEIMMLSLPLLVLLVPRSLLFHGELWFHRLKQLNKSDRRGNLGWH